MCIKNSNKIQRRKPFMEFTEICFTFMLKSSEKNVHKGRSNFSLSLSPSRALSLYHLDISK